MDKFSINVPTGKTRCGSWTCAPPAGKGYYSSFLFFFCCECIFRHLNKNRASSSHTLWNTPQWISMYQSCKTIIFFAYRWCKSTLVSQLPIGGRTVLWVPVGCTWLVLCPLLLYDTVSCLSSWSPTEGSVFISVLAQFVRRVLTYSSVLLTVCIMHPVLSWQYFWGSSEKQQLPKVSLIAEFTSVISSGCYSKVWVS